MPRGRKPEPESYEEKIKFYQLQIENNKQAIEIAQQRIDAAQIKINEIVLEKEQEEFKKLISAIKGSGHSIQDVLSFLHAKEESA